MPCMRPRIECYMAKRAFGAAMRALSNANCL